MSHRVYIAFSTVWIGISVGLLGPLQVAKAQEPVLAPEEFDAVAVALDDAARAQRGELPFYGRLLELNARTSERGAWAVEGERIEDFRYHWASFGGYTGRAVGTDL